VVAFAVFAFPFVPIIGSSNKAASFGFRLSARFRSLLFPFP
jgi:hypothetical protein